MCSKILDWIAAVQLGFMTPKCLTCCDDYAVYILLFYVQNIKSVFLLVERYFEVFIDICVICNVNHLGTVCIWLWQHFFFFWKAIVATNWYELELQYCEVLQRTSQLPKLSPSFLFGNTYFSQPSQEDPRLTTFNFLGTSTYNVSEGLK